MTTTRALNHSILCLAVSLPLLLCHANARADDDAGADVGATEDAESTDAGFAGDTGSGSFDAGEGDAITSTDAGSGTDDAGGSVDAGVPSDDAGIGSVADAGESADTGTTADASGNGTVVIIEENNGGGCVAARRGPRGVASFDIFLTFLGLLGLSRARSRRSA